MRCATAIFSILFLGYVLVGCSMEQYLPANGFLGFAPDRGSAVYFAKGDLEADVPHGLAESFEASLVALQRRNYTIQTQERTRENGAIRAIGSGVDQDIKINFRRRGPVTHISIRSGLFGDETISKNLFTEIESRLRS